MCGHKPSIPATHEYPRTTHNTAPLVSITLDKDGKIEYLTIENGAEVRLWTKSPAGSKAVNDVVYFQCENGQYRAWNRG